jgi:Asp-tRNA(Asn)/Glu-tRNA(Gln) amidotransferase A subunit family amidase
VIESRVVNTIAFDSTGLPAVNEPTGFSSNNMPVGVQIVGAPFKEEKILSLAYARTNKRQRYEIQTSTIIFSNYKVNCETTYDSFTKNVVLR